MDEAQSPELSEAQSRALAAKLREELARRRMSRQRLADEAKISISTLEKALNGSRPFTLATIVRLEEALGMKLRAQPAQDLNKADEQAPVELGAYSSAAVKWLEGDYLTLRPSFEIKDTIYAYRTVIAWDAAAGCLAFSESERMDAPFSQKGFVSIPNKSGHVYLHTNDEGQFRLAILGRPQIGGEMYGLLTTLQAGPGTQLLPVSTPIALIPFRKDKAVFGRITSQASAHSRYREYLSKAIAGGFARLVTL